MSTTRDGIQEQSPSRRLTADDIETIMKPIYERQQREDIEYILQCKRERELAARKESA